MRRIGGCLAFAVALLARQATAQTRTDERWPLDSGGSVRIMNPFGRVRVLGWDADSLAVSARLERQAGRFFAAGDVHVRKLGVDTAAGGAGADLEVHVPRGATVWVKAATASIVAEFDLLTIGGRITNERGDAQPKQRATGTGQELRFSSGPAGSGAQITARSFKGPILLGPK